MSDDPVTTLDSATFPLAERPMDTLDVSIVGGSGYAAGELLRLISHHPSLRLKQVASGSRAGRPVEGVHPHLAHLKKFRFCATGDLEPCDVLFLGLPHGKGVELYDELRPLARLYVDLSSDFRLHDPKLYEEAYGRPHPRPELLEEFVYGLPELHRDELRSADAVACPGCNATAIILALRPLVDRELVRRDPIVVEVKAGTSQAGSAPGPGSHHPARAGSIRTYRPAGHRHGAEVVQELGGRGEAGLSMTATALDRVRGVQAVGHLFTREPMEERDLWATYRKAYGDEPFVRLRAARRGAFRLPDPKLLAGTNFCDVGFARDPEQNRVVALSALDNMMKGAAGQAVQCVNLMAGFPETAGLEFTGLYPL